MSSSAASSSRKSSRMAASVSNVMYTNAVYFPNDRVYRGDTPGQLNYDCINHVYYAFATVTANGGVFLSDEWADTEAECDGVRGVLGSLMYLKQIYPHLQVVLSVGGLESSQAFPVVAADAVLRDNFAKSALGLVEASGLDGIDIMWDSICDQQQGTNFLSLLATVRIYLPENQYLLTAALPADRTVLQYVSLVTAARYLDFINLTAYNFYHAWTPKTGHHARLYGPKDEISGASGVSYLIESGVPGKKILLGVPLFGRSFLHATATGQKFKGVGGEEGSFEYKDLPRNGTKEQVDKKSVAAQCIGGDGGFVTYDNPDTVKEKAAFCKQKGLGGLFYWCAPADAKDSKRSLIATGFRALHSS